MRYMRPAIFLDRDGVIVENRDEHVRSWAMCRSSPARSMRWRQFQTARTQLLSSSINPQSCAGWFRSPTPKRSTSAFERRLRARQSFRPPDSVLGERSRRVFQPGGGVDRVAHHGVGKAQVRADIAGDDTGPFQNPLTDCGRLFLAVGKCQFEQLLRLRA